MKNKKLLKTLAFIVLGVIALTWIIPGTNYNDAGALELEGVNPAGLLGIFGSFDVLSTYFFQNSIIVLLVGALYGVMNKTGAYKELVDTVSSSLKGKEKILVIVSTLLFVLVPALTNIYFPLFVLVPLFIGLLLKVGFNKNVALLSTVASMLIGMSCNISSPIFAQMVSSTTNPYLLVKVVTLVVFTILTVLYALKNSSVEKVSKKEEEEYSFLIVPEKKSNSKTKVKPLALFIILSVMTVLLILGLTSMNIKFFTTMHDAVMGVHFGKFYLFKNLFGVFNAFGKWGMGEVYTLIISTTILIGLVYKLKVEELVEGVIEGGKKFIGIALLISLVDLIVIYTLNSGFLATALRFIVSSGNFALVTISSLLGAPFVSEQSYVAQYNLNMILDKLPDANMDFIALISQLTYGVAMLLAPTSAVLVAGLAYLEKDYKGWFKYIWKLAIVLIMGVFIAVTIASLLKVK